MRKHNAADEEQVEKKEKDLKLERDQELEDLRKIIRSPEGLRFFRRLMAEGMVFQTTFRGNSQSFFLEGQRNLALKFFADVCEAAPEKIAELMVIKNDIIEGEV